MSDIDELKALLKNISIKAFIKYYSHFEKRLEENEFVKLFADNENWKVSSYNTIIYSGKKIFEKDLNELALVYIIGLKKRVEENTKNEARGFLNIIRSERDNNNDYIELLDDEEIYWGLKDLEDERRILSGK